MANFEIVIYDDSSGRLPFFTWADRKLNESQFAALDVALEHVLAEQGMNLIGTNWLKPLGANLYEFRIRHTASQVVRNTSLPVATNSNRDKILLRVFVTFPAVSQILILHGYDKGADDSRSRQQKEIAIARARLKQGQIAFGKRS
jgi:hypothetical protein